MPIRFGPGHARISLAVRSPGFRSKADILGLFAYHALPGDELVSVFARILYTRAAVVRHHPSDQGTGYAGAVEPSADADGDG